MRQSARSCCQKAPSPATRIIDLYRPDELIREMDYTRLDREGRTDVRTAPVLAEHLLDIYINERLTMKVVCTPQLLAELVLGRLLTEGIISGIGEVEQLYVCQTGHRAKVILTDHTRGTAPSAVPVTPTCCTGNRTLDSRFVRYGSLSPVIPIPWSREWVFALADRFSRDTELHSATWAAHSCFLARGNELLFLCEDIGRHNALDKAIGCAMKNGVPLEECVIYTSGRIPTDMAEKVIRASIPILCTKAYPTRDAIELARSHRLTLIGCARGQRMNIYTDPLTEARL